MFYHFLRFIFQSESLDKQTIKDQFFIFSNGMFSSILCQVLQLFNSFNLKFNAKLYILGVTLLLPINLNNKALTILF